MIGRYADRTGDAAKYLEPEVEYRVTDTGWDCSSEILCESCSHADGDCVGCRDAVWRVFIGENWYDARDFVRINVDQNGVVLLTNTSHTLGQILEHIRERTGDVFLAEELHHDFGDAVKIKLALFAAIIERVVGKRYSEGTYDYDRYIAVIVGTFQEIGHNCRLLEPMMPW